MPAKSKAQFQWANAAYGRGEISKKVRDEYVEGVDYDSLPERVESKSAERRGKLAALDRRLRILRRRR